MHAPWVKHYMNANMENYIIPNTDSVVLGGTTQKGNWETTASQEVRLGSLATFRSKEVAIGDNAQYQRHYPTTL